MNILHFNIKYLRELSKLTQKEVEDAIGLTRGVLSSYENGTDPRLKNLIDLVKFFKLEFKTLTVDLILNTNLSTINFENESEEDQAATVKQTATKKTNKFNEISIVEKRKLNTDYVEQIANNPNIDERFHRIFADVIAHSK